MTDPTPPSPLARRRTHGLIALAVIVLVAVGLVTAGSRRTPPAISYQTAIETIQADRGQVEAVTLDVRGTATRMTVTFTDPTVVDPAQPAVTAVTTHFPTAITEAVLEQLDEAGVTGTVVEPARTGGGAAATLVAFGPLLLVLILGGTALAVRGRVFADSHRAQVPCTRFADIAGVGEVVDELAEVVGFLNNPSRYATVGAKPPRGVLLTGPPGTDKTLLARAVAGEANVPFYSVTGSDFMEMFVGVGASRVRKLFRAADAHDGGAIVFIDEIDAIGRARTDQQASGGTREQEQTLNQLLSCMDGFDAHSSVIVIAATNRPEILDGALTRPGRFDRQILVGPPDKAGRDAILRIHLGGRADGIDLAPIVARTPGRTGAFLASLVDHAARIAAEGDAATLDGTHLERALEELSLGRARTGGTTVATDQAIVAWHEAGHAVAGLLLDDADDPVKATIVPRGTSGGSTWSIPDEATFRTTRQLRAQLVVALAGRAAEKLLLDGDYTQGASGDLQAATRTATQMVCDLGMSADVGPVVVTESGRQVGASADLVSGAVRQLLVDAQAGADELVEQARPAVQAVATLLLDLETVDGDQIRTAVQAVLGPMPDAHLSFVDQPAA